MDVHVHMWLNYALQMASSQVGPVGAHRRRHRPAACQRRQAAPGRHLL